MKLSDIRVMYLGKYDMYCPSRYYHEQLFTPYEANVNSKFKIVRDLNYAYYRNERLPLRLIVTSETYYIDDIVVDERTWKDVYKIISDNIQAITGKAPKQLVKAESDDTVIWSFFIDYMRGMRATANVFDDFFPPDLNECVKKILKGDNDMKNLSITNYKYNPETRTCTIWWSDKSLTSVTADPDTEANEFTGFCAACAKKLFGNKSTYLNQFDKWTVKIPAKQKAEAEKKAAEDKIHAEAKAKRDAKKAKRKKKREIEKLAKQIADEYYAQELTEEAEKLAIKKYGVPKSYLDDYDCGYENCNCKEFDVMDDDNITD